MTVSTALGSLTTHFSEALSPGLCRTTQAGRQMTSKPVRSNLPRLTGLRAFAALAVFGFHVSSRWGIFHLPLAYLGYTGVAMFFVLSGFVLAWSTRPGTRARTFYRRRFARIYPAHLTVLLAAAVVPVVQVARSLPVALPNLFLVQSWSTSSEYVYGMNGDSWSLSCEMAFYAAFPLAFYFFGRLSNRSRWALAGAWWAAATVIVVFNRAQGWAYYYPPLQFGEFVLGMAAAFHLREGRPVRVPLPLALAVLGAGILVSRKLPYPVPAVALALAFVLVIAAAARRDIEAPGGWLGHRWVVYAGEVSYSFYLVHELTIINVHHLMPGVPGWAQAGTALAVACMLAVVLHHLVERPCRRWLTGSRRSADAVVVAPDEQPGPVPATSP